MKVCYYSIFSLLFGYFVVAVIEMLLIFVLELFGVSLFFIRESFLLISIIETFEIACIIILARTDKFRSLASKNKSTIPYIITTFINVFIFVQLYRIIINWVINDEASSSYYMIVLFSLILIVNAMLVWYSLKSQREISQKESYREYKKLIIPLIENSRSIEHDF